MPQKPGSRRPSSNQYKYDSHCTMIHFSLTVDQSLNDGLWESFMWLGEQILWNPVKRNPWIAWVGALAMI